MLPKTIRRLGLAGLVISLASLAAPADLCAAGKGKHDRYAKLKATLSSGDASLRQKLRAQRSRSGYAKLEAKLLRRVDRLFAAWLGSRWGLGMPQSTVPHRGKTNCGLFVAVILRDAGFRLPIWKFNRQAAYHAIRSVAPRSKIRYIRGGTIKRFIAKVRAMGPGLYLIGLDFHIGFLRVTKRNVRFVHGSYLTKRVMNEPAAKALPIIQSRARMVGKILQPKLLSAWLKRERIKVLGPR